MRVLHVAECVGGVDRYLRSFLKYSTCENIMILSQLYNEADYRKLAHNVEIMNMNHGIGFSAIREAIELRRKIKKYNPNVVFAHSSIAGAIARMACVGLRVNVIYNPHGWSFNMEGKNRKSLIALERIMAHFCDAIICISEAEKLSAIKEKICNDSKLHVINNGIDIDTIKNDEAELPLPDDTFVVGMVGRICKQKAPDVFVKMAAEVQKQIKGAQFVIVGDVIEGNKKEREDLERLAETLGVNLYITGWVDNPLSYMKRFNVGCLLSRWEGFGLVIPEYMMTGIPIVATKVDAIPFLINDGVDGLLVEKDNWRMAAEKVVDIAMSNELQSRLIENGKKVVVQKFDARRMTEEIEQLYEVKEK